MQAENYALDEEVPHGHSQPYFKPGRLRALFKAEPRSAPLGGIESAAARRAFELLVDHEMEHS